MGSRVSFFIFAFSRDGLSGTLLPSCEMFDDIFRYLLAASIERGGRGRGESKLGKAEPEDFLFAPGEEMSEEGMESVVWVGGFEGCYSFEKLFDS